MPEPMDDGGNWKDTYLPEDLRGEKFFETIPDVPTLAKVALDTKKMQGGMVKIPGIDAQDAEWDNFYSRLRPPSPDKYEIKPGQMPEGLEYNKNMEKQFLNEVAFKAGLSNRQAQSAIDWWNNTVAALSDEARKEREASSNQLKQEWGREFDGNTGLAKQIALKLGGQEYSEGFDYLDNTTKKILSQVGKMTGNDKYVHGQTTSTSTREEIDKIRNDLKHPFNDPMHRDHESARKHIMELYRKLG